MASGGTKKDGACAIDESGRFSVIQSVMDAMPLGVVVFDEKETAVYANPVAERIFGGLAEQGRVRCGDFISCVHRHDHPMGCGKGVACAECSLMGAMHSTLSSGKTLQEGESFHRRDSGLPSIWIKYRFSSILLDGKKNAVMAVDDITPHKEAEAREAHIKKVLLAIRNVNQLIVKETDRYRLIRNTCKGLVESRGYHNAWIVLFDDAGGIADAAEAGAGKPFLDLVRRMKQGRFPPCAERALAERTVIGVESPPSDCCGCPMAINYTGHGGMAVCLEHAGKVFGLLIVSIPRHLIGDEEERALIEELAGDIAFALRNIELTEERKRIEAERAKLEGQLRQAQKMQAVGILAGGIAHDFNNILTPVIIQTELALLSVPEDSSIRPGLQEVLEASYRAKDLVKQILTFSRQTERERVPLKLAPIVKEALKLLRSTLPTTIEIQQDIQAEAGTVLADPTQVHQILMNLCTNAAHAMRETGGLLRVALSETRIEPGERGHPELAPGNYVKLSVHDTGCGIDPSAIDHIFDPFFTTKDRSEGTGMGLSVVHGIVSAYGGAVIVESEPGKGSTFRVFLPRTVQETGRHRAEPIELPRGREHILVVDDEALMIQSWVSMLRYLGYEVTAETNSISALNAFRRGCDGFDLVIVDQTMPHMRGDELIQKLVAMNPTIPVILCTGYSEAISEKEAKEIGADEFIMKPIIMEKVAKTIRKVLDRG